MTTQEQIAVMQAYADGKKIQWSSPVDQQIEWMDTDEPLWNWGACTYRVKPEPVLPKTWEEFCETDKAKEIAKEWDFKYLRAFDALCKLIQLRDCYNDGWQPDWTDDTMKYVIYPYKNDIEWDYQSNENRILVFKTKELRNEFYENFKDLIEIAKPLL